MKVMRGWFWLAGMALMVPAPDGVAQNKELSEGLRTVKVAELIKVRQQEEDMRAGWLLQLNNAHGDWLDRLARGIIPRIRERISKEASQFPSLADFDREVESKPWSLRYRQGQVKWQPGQNAKDGRMVYQPADAIALRIYVDIHSEGFSSYSGPPPGSVQRRIRKLGDELGPAHPLAAPALHTQRKRHKIMPDFLSVVVECQADPALPANKKLLERLNAIVEEETAAAREAIRKSLATLAKQRQPNAE